MRTAEAKKKKSRVPESHWEWSGNAGHCIVGQWCRFHLYTRIGKWIISTIGEYVHPRHSAGSERAEAEWLLKNKWGEEIGCGRKYETLVFKFDGKRCDCGCEMSIPSDWTEVAGDSYNDPGAATRGHMELCRKYAKETT